MPLETEIKLSPEDAFDDLKRAVSDVEDEF